MAVFINRQAPQSGIASLLALQGRGGDTELVHMTKPEVNRLQNSGLMSVNPDTGLPEYFLGDIFDTVKASVKNYFKPENLIPAIASVALPAIAGPYVPPGVLETVGRTGTQAILSGTGTALGSLPFRSPSDALSAGIVSGGLQYGGSKLKEFLGGVGGGSAYDLGEEGTSRQQRIALGKAAAGRAGALYEPRFNTEGPFRINPGENYLSENSSDIVGGYGGFESDAYISGPLSQTYNEFYYPETTEVFNNNNLEALKSLSPQAANLLDKGNLSPRQFEVIGREVQALPQEEVLTLTGFRPTTYEQGQQAVSTAIETADQIFEPTLNQQGNIVTADALANKRYVTPQSFDRFSKARASFGEGNYLDAAKEFGSELSVDDFGRSLASVEATGLVDAVELQRLAQEREAQRLIESGVPEPIARRRVARRRASGEFGTGGAGLTAAEARRRAIEGGGFEFFGPTQFVAAAQGGLVSLGHGGQPDFEGIVGGDGHGMEDNQIMGIKGGGLLAVSPKEYVVPADVMAMLGNGNPDDGADDMDKFIADFRQKKYGRDKQPPEMDGGKALQSLMS